MYTENKTPSNFDCRDCGLIRKAERIILRISGGIFLVFVRDIS